MPEVPRHTRRRLDGRHIAKGNLHFNQIFEKKINCAKGLSSHYKFKTKKKISEEQKNIEIIQDENRHTEGLSV